MAPSSPPPPSAAALMWLIPDSNERILLHATPVPTTIVARRDARRRSRSKATWHQPRLLATGPQTG